MFAHIRSHTKSSQTFKPIYRAVSKLRSLRVNSIAYSTYRFMKNLNRLWLLIAKKHIYRERKSKQTERQGNKGALFITAFHHHTTSLELVLSVSELGPTHSRSVLGGVRNGSKNRAHSSITWFWPFVYWAISGPRLLCIRFVKNFHLSFSRQRLRTCYLVWYRRKEHYSAILHCMLGGVVLRTTHLGIRRGRDIYRTKTYSTTWKIQDV